MGEWRARPADPFDACEPFDSSAAAIAAQGLVWLGWLLRPADPAAGERYLAAGLTVLRTLTGPPFLSEDPAHEGLLLHSVYHRPRGWGRIPPGAAAPCGEASQWDDYHLREVGRLVQRLAEGGPPPTFFGNPASAA